MVQSTEVVTHLNVLWSATYYHNAIIPLSRGHLKRLTGTHAGGSGYRLSYWEFIMLH